MYRTLAVRLAVLVGGPGLAGDASFVERVAPAPGSTTSPPPRNSHYGAQSEAHVELFPSNREGLGFPVCLALGPCVAVSNAHLLNGVPLFGSVFVCVV